MAQISKAQPMRPAEIALVEQVTNIEFTARIFNLSNTSVTGVTLNYIALSGR